METVISSWRNSHAGEINTGLLFGSAESDSPAGKSSGQEIEIETENFVGQYDEQAIAARTGSHQPPQGKCLALSVGVLSDWFVVQENDSPSP